MFYLVIKSNLSLNTHLVVVVNCQKLNFLIILIKSESVHFMDVKK